MSEKSKRPPMSDAEVRHILRNLPHPRFPGLTYMSDEEAEEAFGGGWALGANTAMFQALSEQHKQRAQQQKEAESKGEPPRSDEPPRGE